MSYEATNWANSLPLHKTPKAVLKALCDRVDRDGFCFPGQKRLASDTGLSERTVLSALAYLEEIELIARSRRQRHKDGLRTSDRTEVFINATLDERSFIEYGEWGAPKWHPHRDAHGHAHAHNPHAHTRNEREVTRNGFDSYPQRLRDKNLQGTIRLNTQSDRSTSSTSSRSTSSTSSSYEYEQVQKQEQEQEHVHGHAHEHAHEQASADASADEQTQEHIADDPQEIVLGRVYGALASRLDELSSEQLWETFDRLASAQAHELDGRPGTEC